MSTIVVVGDALLDTDLLGTVERVCPDAPVPVVDCTGRTQRPGGAGLAACLAARAGHDVALVAPWAPDAAGAQLRHLVEAAGVTCLPLPAAGTTPEKARVRVAGQSMLRLDSGGLQATGELPAAARRALRDADAVLVADYGTGSTALPALRDALEDVARLRPLVWDPHPKGSPCTAGTTLITPNEREAAGLSGLHGGRRGAGVVAAAETAKALLASWRPSAVAVTLGARGALLVSGAGTPLLVGAERVTVVDACGAGDCFAAAAAAALAGGAVLSEAVAAAVEAATAFVAGAGTPVGASPMGPAPAGRPVDPAGRAVDAPHRGSAAELAARVRAAGGTVVVAGGCFDLLHRGHVELLRAARELGDCLIVALNSDVSVRALKGEGRPVLPEAERAAILQALSAVDAVVCFDEPTPLEVLQQLRPHLFVKGGDYAGLELPEQPVLARWGGEVVTVPYLRGRSTSRIVEEVRRAR